jgi:hypothetical protein
LAPAMILKLRYESYLNPIKYGNVTVGTKPIT